MNRLPETEKRYQEYLSLNIPPFSSFTLIKQYEFWMIIKNDFPYDAVFDKHHLLLPKRKVSQFRDITIREQEEYHAILHTALEQGDYDFYFINANKKRSVQSYWHAHLATWQKNQLKVN